MSRTPGPWRHDGSYVRGGDWKFVAAIHTNDNSGPPQDPAVVKANGDLIAAAPQLLAAAKRALRALELEYGEGCSLDLEAAIAKAEGKL